MTRSLVLAGLFVVSTILADPATSQSPATDPLSLSSLRRDASESLRRGDRTAAIKAADAMVADYSDNVQAMVEAGDVYLRAGKPGSAVVQFDRFIEKVPAQMPYLWQRGIALYFVGKYQAAADQFAKHRAVNPHDVENAAWHFVCIAKAQSPQKARQMLLPAPGDGREPMNEVLEMLSSGDTKIVRDRIDLVVKRSPESGAAEDAKFYGELYLGLYADALGDIGEAIERMKAASTDAPRHYMGDVGRVYAEELAKRLKTAE